jgi:hypothetical protein
VRKTGSGTGERGTTVLTTTNTARARRSGPATDWTGPPRPSAGADRGRCGRRSSPRQSPTVREPVTALGGRPFTEPLVAEGVRIADGRVRLPAARDARSRAQGPQ